MSIEEKFNAAVNVIKGLPKSGSYQPSNDLLLRFYSYYKQATEGKCTKSKPAFWDIINKAKWEAWKALGDMSPEQAMKAYVNELHNIVETMSYTDNVAAFLDAGDSDIPISKEDLYLVAGDVLKKSKSTPSTPIAMNGSRETSPYGGSSEHLQNGHIDSEDEYIDTVENHEMFIPIPIKRPSVESSRGSVPNGHASLPGSGGDPEITGRVLDELQRTVNMLERDLTQLKGKVAAIEKDQSSLKKSLLYARPRWWPLKTVSPAFLAAIVLWPIIANRLYAAAIRRRRT